MAKSKNVNYQMTILSVIAISFVILGHINFPTVDNAAPGTLYGWFPYYSFHLPLFLFISGYFYRDFYRDFSPEKGFFRSFGSFIFRKFKSLIIPYYIVNGVFLIAGIFLRSAGFTYLQHLSFTDWLVFPWTRLYTITYSVPTWYMIALFIAEIYFVLLRQLFRCIIKNEKIREIIILVLTLAIGVAAVLLSGTKGISQTALVYLRSAVMLFFIQFGVLYRKYLEKHDTLPSVPYFLILLAIQFLIILLSGNAPLSPGLYGLINFAPFGADYFLAGLTGLLLWLRIARILSSVKGRSNLIIFIGSNTKYIMCFHVFGFFLLNTIFSLLKSLNPAPLFLKDFSQKIYKGYLYYVCNNNLRMNLLYFLAAMAFSLLMSLLIRKTQSQFRKSAKKRIHQT